MISFLDQAESPRMHAHSAGSSGGDWWWELIGERAGEGGGRLELVNQISTVF